MAAPLGPVVITSLPWEVLEGVLTYRGRRYTQFTAAKHDQFTWGPRTLTWLVYHIWLSGSVILLLFILFTVVYGRRGAWSGVEPGVINPLVVALINGNGFTSGQL